MYSLDTNKHKNAPSSPPSPHPKPSKESDNKNKRHIQKKVDGGRVGGGQSSCHNSTGLNTFKSKLAIHSLAVNGLDNGSKWLRQFHDINRTGYTLHSKGLLQDIWREVVSVWPCLWSCYDNGSINVCVTQVLYNGQVLIRGAGGRVHHKEVHLTPVNIT